MGVGVSLCVQLFCLQLVSAAWSDAEAPNVHEPVPYTCSTAWLVGNACSKYHERRP